jgi:hypothetical protein
MTEQEAKILSIRKWQWIVDNEGRTSNKENIKVWEAIPELEDMIYYCPYCELFWRSGCKKCPLNLRFVHNSTGCHQLQHPFYFWCCNTIKANAQKVLDLIINTGVEL